MKVEISRRRKSPDTGTKYQADTPETQPSATESEIYPSHRLDGLCSVYFATASSPPLRKLPLAFSKGILRKALRGGSGL